MLVKLSNIVLVGAIAALYIVWGLGVRDNESFILILVGLIIMGVIAKLIIKLHLRLFICGGDCL
jgi:hypothetical protein